MTEKELLAFFNEIQLTPGAKTQAVRELAAQNGCRLTDLATSRTILQRHGLID